MPNPINESKPIARVLVVEDHPDIGKLMQFALARSLIEAILVTTGEEALTRLTTETYDLILLDINLPGMSGLEVCRQLKADEKLKAIPVIFVSAQTGPAYKEKAQRLGAVDYIEKPFDLLPFLACIMGHLNLKTEGGLEVRKWWPLPVP